jgi:tRNA-Thr(GGU) m(6)t(6)A37 methyltransferase TsaA
MHDLRIGASQADDVVPRFSVEPIGFVRSPLATKVEAERQPGVAADTAARIELLPGRNFEHALEDLASWELIWVIFWFHHNAGWRPKVLPPRSTTGRKGVFATRSPHRPNPLGLSVVKLERIDGLTLHIRDADMLDGTPVLDLKPYIAYADAHPEAGTGWLDGADPVPAYIVHFDTLAAEQVAWIETHPGLAIGERIRSTLTLGPAPHPYRRIRRMENDLQLAVKEWRVRFTVADRDVRVTRLESGFRASQLAASDLDEVCRKHKAFSALWPSVR